MSGLLEEGGSVLSVSRMYPKGYVGIWTNTTQDNSLLAETEGTVKDLLTMLAKKAHKTLDVHECEKLTKLIGDSSSVRLVRVAGHCTEMDVVRGGTIQLTAKSSDADGTIHLIAKMLL